MAQFYTLEEAARVLGMGPEELKTKAQQREVRAFMDGGSWRFRVADVDELARRRGLGSDPDLSLSDLDLVARTEGTAEEGGDFDLSEYDLNAFDVNAKPSSDPMLDSVSDRDILLDDLNLPPNPIANTSSTIIGLEPAEQGPKPDLLSGARPDQSDVRMVPRPPTPPPTPAQPQRYQSDVRPVPREITGASDSDVRPVFHHGGGISDSDISLSPKTPDQSDPRPPAAGMTDSDVRLAPDLGGSSSSQVFSDPSASHVFTTSPPPPARPGPKLGSSGEIEAPPASRNTAAMPPPTGPFGGFPDSGSDFELEALDSSDEFDTTPAPRPGDSDVTGYQPSQSGINLGRPSDSGINLQSPGFSGLGASGLGASGLGASGLGASGLGASGLGASGLGASGLGRFGSGIELSPASDELSATAMPVQPMHQSAIEDDTDFELEAGSSTDDRTVQLDAQSDFDLSEGDDPSTVLPTEDEVVDSNAATSLGASPALEEAEDSAVGVPVGSSGSDIAAASAATSGSAWDIPTPEAGSTATRAAGTAPVLASTEARHEWGGVWVGFLMVATVFVLLLTLVSMDLLHNIYGYQGRTPIGSSLAESLAGLLGSG